MSKPKGTDYSLGSIFDPVIDLLSEILLLLVKVSSISLIFLVNKLFKRESSEIKKVERGDLNNNTRTLQDNSIGYSVSRKRNILGAELNKAAHTAVVGASGSGKTVLLDSLMYEDMKQGKPVVYIDPKGDNETLTNFINLCRLTGREYYVFSEYYTGQGSCSLNPVKDGSPTNIADRIHSSFTWSEEHYAQVCRDALEDAIEVLISKEEEVSIGNIHKKLLDISDLKQKDKLLYDRKDIQGILSRLKKLIKSDFGAKLTGADSLSFKDIRKSNKCVYIGLSVLGFSEIARSLGKIILGDISYSAYDVYKKLTPTSKLSLRRIAIYIDELSAVITDEFIEILNKVRGAKMELTFAFQSPSDIAKYDKDLCIQVLENSANWFIFKQRMEEGADTFAGSIGTIETKKQTIRVEDGEELSQGSQRVVEELVAHHNIIKNLNVGQCILLRHYPTQVDLLNVKYIDPEVLEVNANTFGNRASLTNRPSQYERKLSRRPVQLGDRC